MAKKRPTLDAFLIVQPTVGEETSSQSPQKGEKGAQQTQGVDIQLTVEDKKSPVAKSIEKPEIVRHMLYLPLPVYDQLQELVFEEQRGQLKRRKTHDYLLDAIDLLFKKKGLKSIATLTSNKK